MKKSFKSLIIVVAVGAIGAVGALVIATSLAFAGGNNSQAVAPMSHGSVPFNHSKGYSATHTISASHAITSARHGAESAKHGKGYTATHTINATHAITAAWHGSESTKHSKSYTVTHTTHAISQTAVLSVVADSPAAAAGLTAGDVIVMIDGKAIATAKDLPNAVSAKKPGDTLKLEVRGADGTTRSVSVTLGKSSGNANQAYLGVMFGKRQHHAPKTALKP